MKLSEDLRDWASHMTPGDPDHSRLTRAAAALDAAEEALRPSRTYVHQAVCLCHETLDCRACEVVEAVEHALSLLTANQEKQTHSLGQGDSP